ncbi:MAG: aminotransferase class IV [Planctomycetota bacterium]|jgi:branched-chain amino acid aminotransferase
MSTPSAKRWVWTRAPASGDSSLVPADEARVSPLDRGFQYGDGVFETLRAEGGKVFFLEAHLERMRSGIDALGIDLPDAARVAREGLAAVLEKVGPEGAAALKVIVTRGTGPAGPSTRGDFAPSVVVTGSVDPRGRPASMRAITSSVVRNERSPVARVKSLNYLEMVLARREAEARGAEEAIVLNTHGRVAEASAANVFAVRGEGLLTPPVEEGCLPGIVRAEVLRLAPSVGLDVAVEPLTIGRLREADEAFLTNSRIGVVPLVEFDGKVVGRGEPGAVSGRVREALRAAELASAHKPEATADELQ